MIHRMAVVESKLCLSFVILHFSPELTGQTSIEHEEHDT